MDEIDDFLDLGEETGILINDKYKIETYDALNVVVKEKYIPKEVVKDDNGNVVQIINKKTQWKAISYHANLEQAFNSIVDREINMSVNGGLEDVIDTITELKKFKEVVENGISRKS